ncbi:hypothetical protein GALMADRAFT_136446 [Galerina marginata CBS 339.88]|uniref:DUF6534 domain-containing protein n=1 Tax=Galerina marginata (strain CBS 339.88) TaxID=685588 RepID=A0A067TLM2_GALM3|nr:hypothetical protein GALMADRAFT_136446 [Galerina marginata CBS 339.88]
MLRRYVDPVSQDAEVIPSIYGPMLIGLFCSLILYGVLIAQIYNYWITDLPIVRRLVLYLFVIETAHSACAMFMLYQPLVINFGKDSAYHNLPTALPAEPILTALISVSIQVFTAWRIWRIKKSLWIPGIICVLATLSAAGGLWAGIKLSLIRLYSKTPQAYPAVYLWLFSAAAGDILITVSLTVILSRCKPGIQAVDAVVSRIIVFTIQTGLITSVAAIADVILLLTLPHIALSFLVDILLVKIYAISLMSTLNTREALNRRWENQHSSGVDLAQLGHGAIIPMVVQALPVIEPMVFQDRTTVLDLEGQHPLNAFSTSPK